VSAFVINPYAFTGPTFEFAYLAGYTDAANLTTYTFNSVDFGVADANRHIVVAFMSRGGSSIIEVSSATIGGVSATIDAKTDVINNCVAVLRANVTSGTSGTVSVTLSVGSLRAAIGVYRLVAGALVVSDADTATGTTAAVTLDTGAGCVIAAAVNQTTTISWTNATENTGGDLEFSTYSSASAATTAGSLTVTATSTNSGTRLAAVSYS
jgi:hypothetical protein